MTYSSYSKRLITALLLTLCLVAAANYIKDPAGVFSRPWHDKASPEEYVQELLASPNGLLWPNDSWNIRNIKQQLARKTDADVAVLGSSHAMQVGSQRLFLPRSSPIIVNLAVSGGTLEDVFALCWELVNNPTAPKALLIAIDPWTLRWDSDRRFETYSQSYEMMRMAIGLDDSSGATDVFMSKLGYLLSYATLTRSMQTGKPFLHAIQQAEIFPWEAGTHTPVLLPDGTIVYSASYLEKRANSQIPAGGTPYKLPRDGHHYSEDAIQAFVKLIDFLRKKQIAVSVLLTPYHPNVWLDQSSDTVLALKTVEDRILRLCRTQGIPMYGTYDPNILECGEVEFYDDMHPTPDCLTKIINKYVQDQS